MTNKIVLFHLNQVGYGGTEKAILSFIEQMESLRASGSSEFIPYLFFQDTRGDFKSWRIRLTSPRRYKKRHLDAYAREKEFVRLMGQDRVLSGSEKDFFLALEKLSPAILHFNRGEPDDFYTRQIDLIPKSIQIFETNIFGRPSSAQYLKRLSKIFFVSQWLMNKSPWASPTQAAILYNPIESAHHSQNLRDELGIPSSAQVIGMMGRPDLETDDFIQNAIEPLITEPLIQNSVYLLILGMKPSLKNPQNSNVRFLSASTDAGYIGKFYNSIDILAHRRLDGETFGMIIAEAMMHGKPVVSHESPVDNAQAEVIGNARWISRFQDSQRYQENLRTLLTNPTAYHEESQRVKQRANSLFRPAPLTQELLQFYRSALEK